MKVFELFAELSLKDQQFNKGIEQAERKSKGLARTLAGTVGKTGKIVGGAMLGAFTAIGAGAMKLGKSFVDMGKNYNMSMENYMANFSTLLGGMDKAQQKMQFISKYAAETPFEMGDIAEAQKTLLAFNVESEQSEKILKMLGDVSLGDRQKFNSLALVFGQMSSTGRLMGQDLLQFINAGFNPLIELSKESGRSVADLKEDMAKGLISVEDVTHAFELATQEGGQFFEGLKKGSQTSAGQLSTLKDNVAALAGKVTSGFLTGAKSNLIPKAMEWIDKLSKAFEKSGIKGFAQGIGNIVKEIGTTIKRNTSKIGEVVRFVTPIIVGVASDIIETVVDVIPDMLPALIEGFVTLFSNLALKLPELLQKTLKGVAMGIFNVVKTGLRRMSGITAETDAEIAKLRGEYESLQDSFKEADKAYKNSIYNIVSQHSLVNSLLDRIMELQNKSKLDDSEKAEMQSLITELKGIDGLDIKFEIDAETGKIKGLTGSLEDLKTKTDEAIKAVEYLRKVANKKRTPEEQKQAEDYIKFLNSIGEEIKLNSDGTFSVVDGNLTKLDKKLSGNKKKVEGYINTIASLQDKINNGTATEEERNLYDDAIKGLQELQDQYKITGDASNEVIQNDIDLLKKRNDEILNGALLKAGEDRTQEIGKQIFEIREAKHTGERDLGYLKYNKEEATGVGNKLEGLLKKYIDNSNNKEELKALAPAIAEWRSSLDSFSFLTEEQREKLKNTDDDYAFLSDLQTFADDYKKNSDEKIKVQEELIQNYDTQLQAKQEELAGVMDTQRQLADEMANTGTKAKDMGTKMSSANTAVDIFSNKLKNFKMPTYSSGGVKPAFRASGGIFNEPSFFPTANSVVGEAGPEAVIPLRDFYNRIDRGMLKAKQQPNITINQYFTTQASSPREIARQTKLSLDRLQFGGNV